jgi:hypothetical protein
VLADEDTLPFDKLCIERRAPSRVRAVYEPAKKLAVIAASATNPVP